MKQVMCELHTGHTEAMVYIFKIEFIAWFCTITDISPLASVHWAVLTAAWLDLFDDVIV